MKLSKTHRLIRENKGSVLMEFILVAPVYFALLGGLFTVGELLLLNNRITVADRNMGYIIPYLSENSPETQGKMLKVMINLTGKNVTEYKEADLGYTKQSPSFTFKKVNNSASVITETKWGTMYATALTVRGVELPSFINGMMAVISVLSGDDVKNEDFVYSLGELQEKQLGRHYVIGRKSDVAYRNAKTTEMLETALKLSVENILGNPIINSGTSDDNADVTQDSYDRVFGDLFSSSN